MCGFRSPSRSRRLSWFRPWALVAVFAVSPAFAQSAADKATARKLATDGIQLYQNGKYAEALDKLNRAESMYDAPVHLLYIARSQVKLGQLVEGAETYRRLVRVKLDTGAPKAFTEAIESGKGELTGLEPTIPLLRIDVTPPNVAKIEILIDGEKVSSAAIGIDRPINPGRHEINVVAPGYEAEKASVELTAGQKKQLGLALRALPGGVAAGPGTPPDAPGTTGAQPSESGATSGPRRTKVGFFAGLRVAGAVPVGVAYVGGDGRERNMADLFGAGGGAEIHAGVKFARYFGAKLLVERYGFDPGSRLDEVPEYEMLVMSVDSTNVTSADGFGIGGMVGLMDRGRFGAYGELSILPLHRFSITRDVEDSGPPNGCSSSSDVLTLSGVALRIGGAAIIPINTFLQLTPYMSATFSSFGESTFESGCAGRIPLDGLPSGKSKLDIGGHQMFVLGVGGDVLLGGP